MARDSIDIDKGEVKTSVAYAQRTDFQNVGNTFHYLPFYTGDVADVWPDRPDGTPYQGITVPAGGIFTVAGSERVTIIARNFPAKIEVYEVGV